jgi:hypothetical protein
MCDFTESVDTHCDGLESVSPGLCGLCPECRSTFNMELNTDHITVEPCGNRLLVRVNVPQELMLTLRYLTVEETNEFDKLWELNSGSHNSVILAAMIEHIDDCSWELSDEQFEKYCSAIIATQDVIDEGSFSHCSCDSCGSGLGGTRYTAHGWTDKARELGFPVSELCHLDICEDCLQYHANGELPG